MTSKNLSSPNFASLLFSTVRRNIWALALSLLAFLFTLPLPVAMLLQSQSENSRYAASPEVISAMTLRNVRSMFGADNAFVKVALIGLAVVCGVALFSYLHSRQKTDFYHSMPVSRGTLFAVNFVAGIVLIVPSYLVMTAVAGLIAMAGGCGAAFFSIATLSAMAVHLTFFLLVYALSVLCTVLCGNTIVTLLTLAWTLFSGAAAVGAWVGVQSLFFKTYVPTGASARLATRLSPVLQYFMTLGDQAASGYSITGIIGGNGDAPTSLALLVLAYLLAAVVAAALSYVLFRRRKSERAGAAIAFAGFKAPLKYWCVVLMSVGGGLLFQAIAGEVWFYFGLLAGGLLTAALMEMIFAFDFKAAFRHWKGLVVCAAAIALCTVGLKTDIMGFDSYLPRAEDVAAVAADFSGAQARLRTAEDAGAADLTDPANIDAVRALAALGMQSFDADPHESGVPTEHINLYYTLKSGKQVARQYYITMDDRVTEAERLAMQIHFSEEYTKKRFPAYTFVPTDHDKLRAFTQQQADTTAGATTHPEHIAAILDALRSDVLTLTQEQAQTTSPVLNLDIGTVMAEEANDPSYSDRSDTTRYETMSSDMAVYATYEKTLALVEKYLSVQPTPLTPQDITSVQLRLYGADEMEKHELVIDTQTVATRDIAIPESMGELSAIVTDKLDIAVLLADAVDSYMERVGGDARTFEPYVFGSRGYAVAVTLQNGSTLNLYYPVGKVPTVIFEKYFPDAA